MTDLVEIHLERTPVRTTKNMWELTIKYMHGDADGYSDEVHRFAKSREGELKTLLYIIEKMDHYENSYSELEKNVIKVLTEAGFSEEAAQKQADNFMDNYTVNDISYHDYLATIDGYDLVWWDEHGSSWDASVKLAS